MSEKQADMGCCGTCQYYVACDGFGACNIDGATTQRSQTCGAWTAREPSDPPVNEAHAALDDLMALRGITPATAAARLKSGDRLDGKRVKDYKEEWIGRAVKAECDVRRLENLIERMTNQVQVLLTDFAGKYRSGHSRV